MKIAVISLAKPVPGTGNGTTEHAYNMVTRFKKAKGNTVHAIHAVEQSKRFDIAGLVKAQLTFARKVKDLAKMDYDIVYITMQELGSAARILKENGSKAIVVTTIHDLIRFHEEMYKNILEQSYNKIAQKNVADAIKYSDYLTFNSSQTKDEVFKKFGAKKNSRVIWHGSPNRFFTPVARKKRGKFFDVGYVGALSQHKNAIAVLRAAQYLREAHTIRFLIYGTGKELRNITRYKVDNNLHNVHLMGFAPSDKMVEIYDSLDVFVMPSNYEGLSHQILEAGARGLPIIVFSSAKIPKEVTKHCLKAKNEMEMAQIINALSKHGYSDAKRKAEMKYYREFSWDRTAKGLLQLFKELKE